MMVKFNKYRIFLMKTLINVIQWEIFMNNKEQLRLVFKLKLDFFINAKLGFSMYAAHSDLVGVEK